MTTETTPPATVTVCGLGNMGSAVAGRLARRFHLIATDIDAGKRAAVTARLGVETTADLQALATARHVVLSLPAPSISASVVRSLLPHLAPGSVVVETSTVNPADMWALRDLCAPQDVRVVDAAILSGVGQMAAGTSTLLVAGDPGDLYDSTLALALALAQASGIPLFAIQGAHTVYELAVAEGYERLDYAAIAKLWETWTDRPLSRPVTEAARG